MDPLDRTAAEVVLYGKPGCCLCDEAKAEIERARARHPFDLREVDVSLDPALNRLYGERVPVVEVGGVETFEYHVDAETLIEALGTVAS
jgi:glutaredoxin